MVGFISDIIGKNNSIATKLKGGEKEFKGITSALCLPCIHHPTNIVCK
jgi:hypothetical protein